MRFALAASLAITLAACSSPTPPTLTPKKASVTAVNATGMVLAVEMDANNPNSFALTAQKVTGTVSISGQPLGSVTVPQTVSLAPQATTTIAVSLNTPWTNLAAIAPLVAGKATVPFTVDGTETIGGDKLNVDLPFHFAGEIPASDLQKAATASMSELLPQLFGGPNGAKTAATGTAVKPK